MIYRIENGLVERAERPTERTFVATGWASTSDPDLDDFVIESEAYREGLALYQRNPVILFNHDRDFVIGRAKKVDIVPRGLRLEAEFDMEDEFAAKVAGKVERGFIRGFSVGFRSLADPEAKAGKLVFKKVQLLEVSVVTIPANPHALIGQDADAESTISRISTAVEQRLIGDRRREMVASALKAIQDETTKARDGLSEVVAEEIGRFTKGLDSLREQVRLFVAEEYERRNGTVRDLVNKALEQHVIAHELERVHSLVTGRATPPPTTGLPAGPGVAQTLVPKETPPDGVDGHKHRIVTLDDTGAGFTGVAKGEYTAPHSHTIKDWAVVDQKIGDRISQHPGTLVPGYSLAAGNGDGEHVEEAIERLGKSLRFALAEEEN